MKKYRFIHATKTGGTALEVYFKENYSNIIFGTNHFARCGKYKNPIIVLRDPAERFVSMFNYWKYGSYRSSFPQNAKRVYERSDEFVDKFKKVDINNFVSFIKNRNKCLRYKFTWSHHFKPQSFWYTGDLKKITVILYKPDLQESVFKLFEELKVENKQIPLMSRNVTKKRENSFSYMNDDSLNWYSKYFAKDIDFYSSVKSKSHPFKLVIS